MFFQLEMYILWDMLLPRTHLFYVQSGFVLRHILNDVQIALVTKSIRVSSCFNVVNLKLV